MTRPARSAAVALAAILVACAGSKPARTPEPAQVDVAVLRGSPSMALPVPRMAILLDAASSMRATAAPGVSRLAAAQVRAAELITAAPPGARVSVDAVGGAADASCGEVTRLAGPERASGASGAADAVRALVPAGEGSLAEGLQSLARSLASEPGPSGARVVALGDLDDACGADLCAAVQALVATGASLDLVILGAASTPECVESVRAPSTAPPGLVAADPVAFQVVPVMGSAVDGTSGGGSVPVAAGPARIRIDLEPPLEIGPVTLRSGAQVRIRVLDFPSATPPVREWSLEEMGSGDGLAASPGIAP